VDVEMGKTLLGLGSIPALVAVNGFFVSAEFSLVSVRRTELEELARQGDARAATAGRATSNLEEAIAATQLGITLASLALGFAGEATAARVLDPLVMRVVPEGHEVLTHSLATALSLGLITLVHVVLGELAPKSIALQRPAAVAMRVAGPLLLFARCTRPVVWLMNALGAAVLRLAGIRSAGTHARVHSPEELRMLVDETREAGLLRKDQAEAAANSIRLNQRTVREVMVPLERVRTIDLRSSCEDLLTAARGPHARMPAHEGDPRMPVGVLNTKDLLGAVVGKGEGPIDVTAMLRAPVYIPPTASVADLLRDMRRHRRPFVIVREGGLAVGIVTIEDAVEQVVGSIEREHERPAAGQTQMILAAMATPSTVIQIDVLRARLRAHDLSAGAEPPPSPPAGG
jgi:putative hemolysin